VDKPAAVTSPALSAAQQMEEFLIATLIQQLKQADGASWNLGAVAFAGLIFLTFNKDPVNVLIRQFDETWFDTNKDKKLGDLIDHIYNNQLDYSRA